MTRAAVSAAVVLMLVSAVFLVSAWACTDPGGGIHQPPAGTTLSGTIPVTVEVTSETKVAGVDLYVDDKYLDTVTASPYTYDWDTTQTSDGAHSLSAKVRAKDRKEGEVEAVSVAVKNQ